MVLLHPPLVAGPFRAGNRFHIRHTIDILPPGRAHTPVPWLRVRANALQLLEDLEKLEDRKKRVI